MALLKNSGKGRQDDPNGEALALSPRLSYGERRAIATLNGMLGSLSQTAKALGIAPGTLDRAVTGSRLHVATLESVRAALAVWRSRRVVHELGGLH